MWIRKAQWTLNEYAGITQSSSWGCNHQICYFLPQLIGSSIEKGLLKSLFFCIPFVCRHGRTWCWQFSTRFRPCQTKLSQPCSQQCSPVSANWLAMWQISVSARQYGNGWEEWAEFTISSFKPSCALLQRGEEIQGIQQRSIWVSLIAYLLVII